MTEHDGIYDSSKPKKADKNSETSGTRHPVTDELYPAHHPAHSFTSEEVADILRFAEEHGIHGVKEDKLFAFIHDVRAAHARRAENKK
ncbi:MAG TPA: hypothetical protein V6D14_14865 [Coleofasciculaceae cyanobacterium]|jgi:hypothetical protein